MSNQFRPIQNYDGLSPQTTKGDLAVFGAAGSSRLAVGANNTVPVADSSVALGIKWAAPPASALPVNTLVGATTLPATSQIVLASGTTFAITLPAPASNSGLTFEILKTDGLQIPISIVNSNGFLGATLQTTFEKYKLVCDGATYWPVDHLANTSWVNYTPTTFGFGTVASMVGRWRRVGHNCEIAVNFVAGTVGATVAFVGLPAGAVAAGAALLGGTFAMVGVAGQIANSVNNSWPNVVPGASGINFGQTSAGANPLFGANGSAVFISNVDISVLATVPIAGWAG